ncbi:hypothetical protein F9L33_15480 [Amylibacter sp. SFDW26]|uniref:hypothetical protein n=1 Tax=Amylibacter sp. SFDW26 TaxID=2652722 RepID=UPI0012623108|nr:hypothetical protein [Amylibacter sp. SFDW26]KAB7609821.1 hypothetical protein F9L33_15480 [Amylibacter sp. SFDW26]
MTFYEIEMGEADHSSFCECCDQEASTTHGFVYKDDDAYAVYYATWSQKHETKYVNFAIAVGEWGDNSSNMDRTCFGLEVYDNKDKLDFRVIEPEGSPWGETDLLGKMLSRQESLEHCLKDEIFLIIEKVINNDILLNEYFEI